MVNWFSREEEAGIAIARHYYDALSDDAKEEFLEGVKPFTIHPLVVLAVVLALGYFMGAYYGV